MLKENTTSRRIFIRSLAVVCLGFFIWIWHRVSAFRIENENNMVFTHGQDIPLGISYFGKYYLFRTGNSVRAFSTTCTHAGCQIGKNIGNILLCNCHGSQFDAQTGKPLKGPAIRPLKELDCTLNEKTGLWTVKFLPQKNIKT